MVGCLAKFASGHRAFNSPCLVTQRTWNLKRCTGDVVLEGILVEEHGAMMLDDHVEVLLQGTVGDEARHLLYANHMPWAAEVICQSTLVRSPHWTGVPRQNLQFVETSELIRSLRDDQQVKSQEPGMRKWMRVHDESDWSLITSLMFRF